MFVKVEFFTCSASSPPESGLALREFLEDAAPCHSLDFRLSFFRALALLKKGEFWVGDFKAYLAATGPDGGGRLCSCLWHLFSSSRLLRKFLTLSSTEFCILKDKLIWEFKQKWPYQTKYAQIWKVISNLLVGESDKISLHFRNLLSNARVLWRGNQTIWIIKSLRVGVRVPPIIPQLIFIYHMPSTMWKSLVVRSKIVRPSWRGVWKLSQLLARVLSFTLHTP